MNNVRIEIKIKGKLQVADFNLPDKWNDVPADLYPHLASIYLADDAELDAYAKTVRAFVLLASKEWKVVEQLKPEELIDLLPLTDWVFNTLDLNKNLQPVINIKDRDFYGPGDGMDNMRFAEWCAADTFFINYSETQDLHELHQLAAVLYRPAGKGPEYAPLDATYRGDNREKFNDQLLKHRTEIMSKLPRQLIHGIYLFFASCRHQIISGYPVTFKSNTEEQIAEVKQVQNHDGWLEIYDDLRSDPKFVGQGNLDEEMLHSVLFSIERNNIKMAQLKDKYDL